MPLCFGGRRACAVAGAAAFGAAPTGAPVGSGFMMLMGGIDAGVGKSMLTAVREPGALD